VNATELSAAYDELLHAADDVAADSEQARAPDGEWDAEQVLGHIVLLSDLTLRTACSTASGAIEAYDNRLALDRWTIARVIALAGGHDGLRTRIAAQAGALCGIVATLSDEELDTRVPTLLTSNDQLLVADQLPLRALLEGLAGTELPAHAEQLRALLPSGARQG
jgi:hypothetical protein